MPLANASPKTVIKGAMSNAAIKRSEVPMNIQRVMTAESVLRPGRDRNSAISSLDTFVATLDS